jgi:hypothetical protein
MSTLKPKKKEKEQSVKLNMTFDEAMKKGSYYLY